MNKAAQKTFTQRELEKIIAERLLRERRNVEAFDELRRTLDALIKDGTINADSYAEAVREICSSISDNAENMRTPEDSPSTTPDVGTAGDVQPAVPDVHHDSATEPVGLSPDDDLPFATVTPSADDPFETVGNSHDDLPFETVGTAPDDDLPFATVTPDTEDIEETSLEKVDYPDVSLATRNSAELCELLEAHPSLDVEKLLCDKTYALYRQKYGGTLLESYDGYSRLLDALEAFGTPVCHSDSSAPDFPSQSSRSARRRLSSTSFSGLSASPDSDAGYDLTPLQREIAKSAGLSYSEYSAMLREVPERRRREAKA